MSVENLGELSDAHNYQTALMYNKYSQTLSFKSKIQKSLNFENLEDLSNAHNYQIAFMYNQYT